MATANYIAVSPFLVMLQSKVDVCDIRNSFSQMYLICFARKQTSSLLAKLQMLRASAQGCAPTALKCGAVAVNWLGCLSRVLGLVPQHQLVYAPRPLSLLQHDLADM